MMKHVVIYLDALLYLYILEMDFLTFKNMNYEIFKQATYNI